MRYLVLLSVILGAALAYDPADQCDFSDTYYNIFKVGNHSCACTSKRGGQLKFTNGKISVCTGGQWKALQYELPSIPFGSRTNPGYSCEDIKTNRKSRAGNGVYWIKLSDNQVFPVYCDMDAGGWTMIFKAVTGVDKNVYDTYNSAHVTSEKVMDAIDVTNKHRSHYKNRIVLKWNEFDPSVARVVLYKGGNPVKELRFNAQGSDKLNWFDASRLILSPWTDVSIQPRNYFSIVGASGRNFFISRNYGGCPVDAGWMGITAQHCDWEKHHHQKNTILYSKLSGYTNWNHYDDIGAADVLAVYLR